MITEKQFEEFTKNLKKNLDNPSHEINCSFNMVERIIDRLVEDLKEKEK